MKKNIDIFATGPFFSQVLLSYIKIIYNLFIYVNNEL